MKFLKLALVPAALVVLATPAAAQMKISGRLDMGVLRAPIDLSKNTDKNWQVAESSNARLNFSGREDLGGGLTAFFMIEHRLNADTGAITDANAFWKDKSWVGLESTKLGEVKIGRVHSPQYGVAAAGRFEAFFGDSYASMGTRGAKSANQWNNSIYYTTPTFGGVNVGLIVRAGESVVARGTGGHIIYANGPLSLAYSYAKEQDTVATTIIDSMETSTLAGYYDFGVIRLLTTYARSTKVNATDTGKEVVFTAGARVPVGSGEIRTSYRKMDDTDIAKAHDASADKDSTRFALGYAYFLSKLTSINLSLVRENQVRYNVNGTTKTDFSGTGAEAALRVMF
jgi:predicted porin